MMGNYIQYLLGLDLWTIEEAVLVVCQPSFQDDDIVLAVYTEPFDPSSAGDMPDWRSPVCNMDIFEAAIRGTIAGTLRSLNFGDDYGVTPKDFITWAENRGCSIPLEVRNALKSEERVNPGANAQREKGGRNREQLLSAAVWCLAHHPEQCRHNGRVTGESLETVVTLYAERFWPELGEPPISGERIRRFYSKCLKGHAFPKGDSSGQTD